MIPGNLERDVFFVFSKSHPITHTIVGSAKELLADLDFEAWEYEDWCWQLNDNRVYGRSGADFDVSRLVTKHPEPAYSLRPGSVDEVTLDQILRTSRVVACVSPLPTAAPGIETEVDQLVRREIHYPHRPYVLLSFEAGRYRESAFDRLDLDEEHFVRATSGWSEDEQAVLAKTLGIIVLRTLLQSDERAGQCARWSDRVAAARPTARELISTLRPSCAESTDHEPRASSPSSLLRCQLDLLEDWLTSTGG